MDLSLVIPCYNEEENVEKFFQTAQSTFDEKGIAIEYVFVNDGSTDSTKENLKQLFLANYESNITVVNFSRNFGKESAIYAGLKNATGDYVCIIDADLQQLPQTALEMYDTIKQNPQYDCICAYQSSRKEKRIVSHMKSTFYKIINSSSDTEFKNGASDFRLFTRKFADAVLSLGEYNRFSKGLFSWVGYNVCYMKYEASKRNSGKSKWTFKALLKYAVNGLLDFTTAPLKFATYIGIFATVFSVVYLIVTVIRKLTSNINADGFTQLVILITFFSGVLLSTIGVIGEYIARIYQQVKNRPIYIQESILKRSEEKIDFSELEALKRNDNDKN